MASIMEKDTKAIDDQPVAAEPVVIPATSTEGDAEAMIAQLQAERDQALKLAGNYKNGMLKAKGKLPSDDDLDGETDEERTRRIIREEMAESRISEIDTQTDALLKKLAKENKELKLAQMNKPPIPSSDTSHSESQKVQDTLVTEEQLKAFKAKGWSDQDIERYKKNLQKGGGR